jgi:hypothetical protein
MNAEAVALEAATIRQQCKVPMEFSAGTLHELWTQSLIVWPSASRTASKLMANCKHFHNNDAASPRNSLSARVVSVSASADGRDAMAPVCQFL